MGAESELSNKCGSHSIRRRSDRFQRKNFNVHALGQLQADAREAEPRTMK